MSVAMPRTPAREARIEPLPAMDLHAMDGKWWALGLLDVEDKLGKLLRTIAVRGAREPTLAIYRSHHLPIDYLDGMWESFVVRASKIAEKFTPQDLVTAEPEVMREVALQSPRAFAELCGLRALNGTLLNLEWFHVRLIRLLRCVDLSIGLMPAQHGKSWNVNMVIPLLDWAEQAEAVEFRVYQKQREFARPITRQLMNEVEGNTVLHALFPWISRPEEGPQAKIWSTDGFCIAGKKAVEPSFRPMTPAQANVGLRCWRVIADDWVTEANCASEEVQERFYNYAHSGVMTMRNSDVQKIRSRHDTRWGTAGFVGTVYDRRDYLARLAKEWKDRIKEAAIKGSERKVWRVSVYPSSDHTQVLWPSQRPLEWVKSEEANLGRRSFRMRYLNQPVNDEEIVFKPSSVRTAVDHGLTFGEPPFGARLIIGYDPASGRKSSRSKYPAMVVLGFRTHQALGRTPMQHVHIIEWARWSVPQPVQIRKLAEMARKYGCPVVVEDNALQRSYAEWMHEEAPDVRVISHHTGGVKHDSRDGVESFQPLFDNGLMHIHAGGAAPNELQQLLDEWLDWPQGKYTDLVMACWIARYQFKLWDRLSSVPRETDERVPAVAARVAGRYTVDLSRYRG